LDCILHKNDVVGHIYVLPVLPPMQAGNPWRWRIIIHLKIFEPDEAFAVYILNDWLIYFSFRLNNANEKQIL